MATGWLVGVSVALAGAIGFIGLVVPHMLRLCGLTDHRVLLPASALAGRARCCLLILSHDWRCRPLSCRLAL